MTILNEPIADYDNEITRLEQGREITRTRKKKRKKKINHEHRTLWKERLVSGIYTPLQFLENISNSSTSGLTFLTVYESSTPWSNDSDVNDELDTSNTNLCVVCLQPR